MINSAPAKPEGSSYLLVKLSVTVFWLTEHNCRPASETRHIHAHEISVAMETGSRRGGGGGRGRRRVIYDKDILPRRHDTLKQCWFDVGPPSADPTSSHRGCI